MVKRMTEVVNLRTGRSHYSSLPPKQAVEVAYQEWAHDAGYPADAMRGTHTGPREISCGHFVAKRGGGNWV